MQNSWTSYSGSYIISCWLQTQEAKNWYASLRERGRAEKKVVIHKNSSSGRVALMREVYEKGKMCRAKAVFPSVV